MSALAIELWLAGFALACAIGIVACTDPGCIRNSECGDGFVCKTAQCVVESVDDAKRIGVDEEDASTKER